MLIDFWYINEKKLPRVIKSYNNTILSVVFVSLTVQKLSSFFFLDKRNKTNNFSMSFSYQVDIYFETYKQVQYIWT